LGQHKVHAIKLHHINHPLVDANVFTVD